MNKIERRRLIQNAWNKKNPEKRRVSRNKFANKQRAFIVSQKEKPCSDCKIQYPPYVMDFDHRPGTQKKFLIGAHYQKTIEVLAKEIAKCDVVCANCHRIRTHIRKAQLANLVIASV